MTPPVLSQHEELPREDSQCDQAGTVLKEQFQGIAWPKERATCDVHVPWEQCLSFPNAATPATQPLTQQPPELGWTPGPGTDMLSDPSWSNSFSRFVLSTYYCAPILELGCPQ